jgi:hypothetical protein
LLRVLGIGCEQELVAVDQVAAPLTLSEVTCEDARLPLVLRELHDGVRQAQPISNLRRNLLCPVLPRLWSRMLEQPEAALTPKPRLCLAPDGLGALFFSVNLKNREFGLAARRYYHGQHLRRCRGRLPFSNPRPLQSA